MKILAKCVHGSKLYGLDGPNSDTDYKAIFQSDLRDLILMRAAKNETKKISEDIEYEGFALQTFLNLACNAEDVAITMLHAPDNKIEVDSDIYKHLRKNKSKFYAKRMIGSLGYSKAQSAKYALRADRMNAVKNFIQILENARSKGVARVGQIWDDLPTGEYYYKGEEETNRQADKRFFECAGKKVTATVAIEYALEIFQNLYDKYGDRVKIASNLDGQDYKAISHAFRCGFQLREIYLNGGFEYPLKESAFLKDVKFGRLGYLFHNLDAQLNELISEVEKLAEKSNFPDKIDRNWVDKVILDAYGLAL
jgi:hypothetical protein